MRGDESYKKNDNYRNSATEYQLDDSLFISPDGKGEAYESFHNLKKSVEDILVNYGISYQISFA